MTAPFEQLDFLYTPSGDVAADARFCTEVLGGTLVFAIESPGGAGGRAVRVALVAMTEGPPHLLLTDHLEGDRTIAIYRVGDLAGALAAMEARGWTRQGSFEIPQGPCCSFHGPGGVRVALYELTRPGVADHFAGRQDF